MVQNADGDFVNNLLLTDIASGWTECMAMPVRYQSLVVEGMTRAVSDVPFPMLGVDTDKDSAFMNQTVFDHRKPFLSDARGQMCCLKALTAVRRGIASDGP